MVSIIVRLLNKIPKVYLLFTLGICFFKKN